MGKAHRSKRPKGYIDWRPNDKWEPILDNVKSVLRENQTYAPGSSLTVRQIFYALVGQYGFDKTEQAYNNLAEMLVKARRARLVSFNEIIDIGGTTGGGGHGYANLDRFLRGLGSWATYYDRDQFQAQPFHILAFCEAEGLVNTAGEMFGKYGVKLTGTGGFASLTVNHTLAMDIVRRDKPTIFMHLGDFDPSGVSIFESMSQDIGAFVADELGVDFDEETGETECDDDEPGFRPVRIGLLPEHIDRWSLESAPPKKSDSRSANWVGETTQLEALKNPQLRSIIDEAIEPIIDWDQVATQQAIGEREDEWIEDNLKPETEEFIKGMRQRVAESDLYDTDGDEE